MALLKCHCFTIRSQQIFSAVVHKIKPLDFVIFLPYPWKFQTRQSSTPGNSTKLCVGSIREIPKPKIKTPAPGNSTSLFFLGHLWKFHLINPQKFHTYAISLIPLEIPYPQPIPTPTPPPCLVFSWNSLMKQSKFI